MSIYSHEAHSLACIEAAQRGKVLRVFVQAKRHGTVYEGRLVAPFTVPGGPDCWSVACTFPELVTITTPCRLVAVDRTEETESEVPVPTVGRQAQRGRTAVPAPLPVDVPVTRQKRLTDEPDTCFVDWISIRQAHEGELPIVSAGVVWAANEAGEVQWRTVKAKQIEGSYETAVQVRCDGNTVSFSGNVSRFGRADNLFGFSFDECLLIVNRIVGALGLPPFTPGTKFYRHVRTAAGPKLASAWTGAVVTRIDLTSNFETGSLANARAYMEWLAGQQGSARIKVGTHGDGETVDWGRGSRALYAKAYLKEFELMRHNGPLELIRHCNSVGLVRFEVTFKATWLHNNGCNYLGGLDMGQLFTVFAERQAVMTRAEHTHDELAELPNHFRRTARDYLAGDNVAGNLSLASFKRHRKALLPYGLDIAVKRNVIDFKPRVRVIEVRPAVVPSWYDFGERYAA